MQRETWKPEMQWGIVGVFTTHSLSAELSLVLIFFTEKRKSIVLFIASCKTNRICPLICQLSEKQVKWRMEGNIQE